MKTISHYAPACLLAIILLSCASPSQPDQVNSSNAKQVALKMDNKFLRVEKPQNDFADYWYQGKAEITSYRLEQARYGEIHQGDAVLVFVTEDFSKSKQVKMDNPSANRKDAVSVLKMNMTKKFNTGVYPYSMMLSSFTPVEQSRTSKALKITTSSQEWCGHTFMQLNLEKDAYQVKSLSYFESEGDQQFKVDAAWLEDEIWAKIRLDPQDLPTGTISMLPGTFYSRLRHVSFGPQQVQASLEKDPNDAGLLVYTLQYPALKRSLSIQFEKEFPYEIISWQESHKSGFGPGAKTLTTRAVKNKSLMLDYWRKHNNEDLVYREQLDLKY